MRKLVTGLLGAAALTVCSTAANASATIYWTETPTGIPSNNDFQGDLNGLGLYTYVADTASIWLTENSILSFEILGTESGFSDRFDGGTVTYTENFTNAQNFFGSPIAIGSDFFAMGWLTNLLFSAPTGPGQPATVGDPGFGIFLGRGDQSGLSTNVFYLGYDDQITNRDDNHDDLIVRVTVSPAVPEPATWAMMLLGFGAAGFVLRRRRAPVLAQAA